MEMEPKTNLVTSELFGLIRTTYSGSERWKQQLCEEIEAKKEDLAKICFVNHRNHQISNKTAVLILTAGFIFILYFAMFAYHCVNNTHCAYEFEDNNVLGLLAFACNYLGRKGVN